MNSDDFASRVTSTPIAPLTEGVGCTVYPWLASSCRLSLPRRFARLFNGDDWNGLRRHRVFFGMEVGEDPLQRMATDLYHEMRGADRPTVTIEINNEGNYLVSGDSGVTVIIREYNDDQDNGGNAEFALKPQVLIDHRGDAYIESIWEE